MSTILERPAESARGDVDELIFVEEDYYESER